MADDLVKSSANVKSIPKPCGDRFRAGDTIRSRSRIDTFDETGALAEMCARHEVVRSVTDLYHGEQFAYVDLILQKFLKKVNESEGPPRKCYSFYDVNCKYYPHQLKLGDQVDPKDQLVPVIPSFHVHSHEEDCILAYHPCRVPFCGLTDGECTERLWSGLGNHHNIVKEMLPASRHEQLEDSLLYFNHQKLLGMGKSLEKKFVNAIEGYHSSLPILAFELQSGITGEPEPPEFALLLIKKVENGQSAIKSKSMCYSSYKFRFRSAALNESINHSIAKYSRTDS